MADALKLYVISSRGFAARLNSVDTTDRLSATHEREWIRRDMKYFCKEVVDSATIPASLFYSLTQLCRSIDAGEIDGSYIRHEAVWAEITDYLLTPRERPVDFDSYRDTICQFLWSYIDREPEIPNKSAPASTSTRTTAHTSNAPPTSAPMPEPRDAEISEAPTPRRNLTHQASREGYDS